MKHLILTCILFFTCILSGLLAPPLMLSLAEPRPFTPPKIWENGGTVACYAFPLNDYQEAILKTSQMVADANIQSLASEYGLNVTNITWEDTGRYQGSSVGPNISDMTIQVSHGSPLRGDVEVTCMPVIRHPNFSDKTCDLDPRDFTLLVGNQKRDGGDLKRISLYEFLEHPIRYLSHPESWKAEDESLLRDRDGKVLVSAQACFLPIPKEGRATFNPVLFNYQSSEGNPAVLTVLATREGTSVTVIDNTRDAFDNGSVWGQRLFHNAAGKRASLTGQRQSEFLEANPHVDQGVEIDGEYSKGQKETGLNMVMLIQIPLKHKPAQRYFYGYQKSAVADSHLDGAEMAFEPNSNVENAVIGHGDLEGPFTEIDDLKIERDGKFPVRVTVQFYKATSNGVVTAKDIREISEQIERIYSKSDDVGSLVTGGRTGRVTEYEGAKIQPAGWWEDFWQRHEENTGDSRGNAIAKLSQLLGKNYQDQPVCDLYLRNLLLESGQANQ